METLKNKTALVTGSGKGVGSGIILDLAKKGANVVLHYNSSAASAEETFRKLRQVTDRCIMVQADISAKEGVEKLTGEAARAFGGIDILVNNAAMQYNMPFDCYPEEKLRNIFAVNVQGYLLMMQSVIPHMKEQKWGRIINISSIHAKRPINFDAPYSMTKGSIKMLTREAAIELAPYQITVNALELGCVDIGKKTGNPADGVTEEMLQVEPQFPYRKNIAMTWGHTVYPEDIGPIVSFLASEDSRLINGASIRADEGSVLL